MKTILTDDQLSARTKMKTMGWDFNHETVQKGLLRLYHVSEAFVGGAIKTFKVLIAEVHRDGRITQVAGDPWDIHQEKQD